jgi:membrane-bound metal-dependent hydrolase YbcI (DUF457 family)
MSSFIGHSLTTLGIYANSRHSAKPEIIASGFWVGWLFLVSLAPDLDYIIPCLRALRLSSGLRITHSIASSLVLPVFTSLALAALKIEQRTWRVYSRQVFLVGISHVLMDLLVGVFPLPLLWPFSTQVYRLPFGILPSAPAFRLDNYYMYRNVLIEVGILVPLYTGLYLAKHFKMSTWWQKAILVVLECSSLAFMYWGYTLAR